MSDAARHSIAREAFGPVGLVMSNVGVIVLGEPMEIPIEACQRIRDVNLLSVVQAIREVLPGCLEAAVAPLYVPEMSEADQETFGTWPVGSKNG